VAVRTAAHMSMPTPPFYIHVGADFLFYGLVYGV
jgi:hypothetical protein